MRVISDDILRKYQIRKFGILLWVGGGGDNILL